MPLPWLRLYTEFASDPKIQILAFEDQRHFVMLLCLKGNGTLDADAPNDAYRERLIAKALGLDPASCVEAKRRLTEGGLIGADWQPIKWGSRQMASDSSTERVRKFREKHQGNVTGTLPERPCNGTDKNREDKIRQDQKEELSVDSDESTVRVFDCWRSTWNHPTAKLDQKRTKCIRSALALGYSPDDLCRSIAGYRNSPHHCGDNERKTVYDALALFLRDAEHIDAGLRFADTPQERKWQ